MKNFIKKIPMLLTVMLLTLLGTVTISFACSYASCGCKDRNIAPGPSGGCSGMTCWYNDDFSAACGGHSWSASAIVKTGTYTTTSSAATCTSGGYETTTYYWSNSSVTCSICERTLGGGSGSDIVSQTWKNALGHIESGWKHDANQHWTVCTRSTNGCGGSIIYAKEDHNWVGSDDWVEVTSAAQVVKKATCTEWGQTKRKYEKGKTCTVCNVEALMKCA